MSCISRWNLGTLSNPASSDEIRDTFLLCFFCGFTSALPPLPFSLLRDTFVRTSAGAGRFPLKFSVSTRWHIGNSRNISNRAPSDDLFLYLPPSRLSRALPLPWSNLHFYPPLSLSLSSLPPLCLSLSFSFPVCTCTARRLYANRARTRLIMLHAASRYVSPPLPRGRLRAARSPDIRAIGVSRGARPRHLSGKSLVGRRVCTRNSLWIIQHRATTPSEHVRAYRVWSNIVRFHLAGWRGRNKKLCIHHRPSVCTWLPDGSRGLRDAFVEDAANSRPIISPTSGSHPCESGKNRIAQRRYNPWNSFPLRGILSLFQDHEIMRLLAWYAICLVHCTRNGTILRGI